MYIILCTHLIGVKSTTWRAVRKIGLCVLLAALMCSAGAAVLYKYMWLANTQKGPAAKMSIKQYLPKKTTKKHTRIPTSHAHYYLLYSGAIKKSSTTDRIVRTTAAVDQESVFLLFFFIFFGSPQKSQRYNITRTAWAHRAYVGRYVLSLGSGTSGVRIPLMSQKGGSGE